MKFEDALKAMRNGKKVTRNGMQDYELWIGSNCGTTVIYKNTINKRDSVIWTPTLFDLLADDWKIVKEPIPSEKVDKEISDLINKLDLKSTDGNTGFLIGLLAAVACYQGRETNDDKLEDE